MQELEQINEGLDRIIVLADKTIKNMEHINEKYQINQQRPVGYNLGNSQARRCRRPCVLRDNSHDHNGATVCTRSRGRRPTRGSDSRSSSPETCEHPVYEWQKVIFNYLDQEQEEVWAQCPDCGADVTQLATALEHES